MRTRSRIVLAAEIPVRACGEMPNSSSTSDNTASSSSSNRLADFWSSMSDANAATTAASISAASTAATVKRAFRKTNGEGREVSVSGSMDFAFSWRARRLSWESSRLFMVVCCTRIRKNHHKSHIKDKQRDTSKMIDGIKTSLKSIGDGEISVSAYDTAWVALVKNMEGDGLQFPSCIDWIVQNQLSDGSWGDKKYFLVQDRMVNTLACIIALKSWNIHHDKCRKGISFINQNLRSLTQDDEYWMLSGFEIVFPKLLEMAKNLGINMPFDEPTMQMINVKRDLKLRKIPKDLLHTAPTTLLISIEGMQNLDWESLMKLQDPDGSFVASPAPTAYTLMQSGDKKCFLFLEKIVQKFNGGGVFKNFERDDEFVCYPGQSNQSVTATFNLYRAAQVTFPGEDELQHANSYSRAFLEERRACGKLNDGSLPRTCLERLDMRWISRGKRACHASKQGCIYNSMVVVTMSGLGRMPLISSDLFLQAAKSDFSDFQRRCRLEWHSLKTWFDKNNLQVFGVTSERALRAYFLAAANIFGQSSGASRMGAHVTGCRSYLLTLAMQWIGQEDHTETALLCALHEVISLAVDDSGLYDLCDAWKRWLRSWTSNDSYESCEGSTALLLVCTLEICSGRHKLTKKNLNLSEYCHLEQLTFSICSRLTSRVLDQSGVNIINEVDLEMQELTQCVLHGCNSINKVTRLSFIHVVKSFYYVAHSSPETINSHISKVIFEDVI
ncbi:hypothetical protein PR202_gb21068 [Eleusine coracana subsp. coracana]|uniref:Uncharacterized protein n=1 Tax=Eleusine coracana subsp. coracana TaxID=191504 RepID=A0AAV5FCM3_ELECO|nr:hypothetical protein PR202_gb21068 [Eleusine coracana subsp. coracana]